MASGGLWSWPSRPCEWPAKRLRGKPVSRTVTLRRARPSCRAAARPAKLPPMMMTSSMETSRSVFIEIVPYRGEVCGGMSARSRRYASHPPANPLLVRTILTAKQGRKRALFGFDLEAVDVEHEGGHEKQGKWVCQERGPAKQFQ